MTEAVRRPKLGKRLTVPVSQSHDLECEPDGQPEYANPVTVNNYQIVYSNALIELADTVVTYDKVVSAGKKKQREVERKMEDLGRRVLQQSSPRALDLKTLKMQDAFISAKAGELGLGTEYEQYTADLRQLEDEIAEAATVVKAARDYIHVVERASNNAMAFLSYYKHEADRVRRGH